MLAPIKVLIVEGSSIMRRMIHQALELDSSVEVVGSGSSGVAMLSSIASLHPEVLLLDIELPAQEGLETLRRVRQCHPSLPVILLCPPIDQATPKIIEALALGAQAYVHKPAPIGAFKDLLSQIRRELQPLVRVLGRTKGRTSKPFPSAPRGPLRAPPETGSGNGGQRIDIVTIAVSTGGPQALQQILPAFPANFPVPLVIVQHMPPKFTEQLARRLDSCCALRLAEAIPGQSLFPGIAWLAPGGFHLTVERQGQEVRLALNQGAPENACRPSADVLFRSVAGVYRQGSLAVVLTGMGQDGKLGCEAIKANGGRVLVQDRDSSVVWGMPGAVFQAGLADQVAPLSRIVPAILQRVSVGRNTQFHERTPSAPNSANL